MLAMRGARHYKAALNLNVACSLLLAIAICSRLQNHNKWCIHVRMRLRIYFCTLCMDLALATFISECGFSSLRTGLVMDVRRWVAPQCVWA